MFKKFKKNENYRIIVGLIIGFVFSSSIVYAWYNDYATEVSYDNSNTWLHSTTVQGAVDELIRQKECPIGYVCFNKKYTLDLGDYVSYTPSKTSYTTSTSSTGYTSTQTFNPSELNLWRVIAINQDGTVDLISENVSTTSVCFRGRTGYQNFVGYLNVLASQYETANMTTKSRHFGYNGQILYITDTSKFTSTAPWTCSTGESCNPVESKGGGDTLYTTDYNLITSVLGTSAVTKVDGTSANYWMASRKYEYGNSISWYWHARTVYNGSASWGDLYYYVGNGLTAANYCQSLRPIVTLKSGLSYSGLGNKDYPMQIQ